MRSLILFSTLLSFILAAREIPAQGQISFRNDVATAITNCLTGARLAAGPGFLVALHAGPIGAPESGLALIAETNCFQAGLFNGGNVVLPGVAAGAPVTLQVRVWETAFGNTYDQAYCAPFSPALGRRALTGKSVLFQAVPMAPPNNPPPLPTAGLNPIIVCVDPCLPTIQCPADITVDCTNASGNIVNFSVSASASCCATNLTLSCVPPSGSLFPPGTNTVRCTAQDGAGNTNVCSFSIVIVCTVPLITEQPVSLTVTQGATATFRVTASGSPSPGYQWRLNGVPIPGATDNVYTIFNVGPNHLGDYDVVISNLAGSVISSAAGLRFPGSGSSDLYIKDTPADTGVEPNPDPGPMWVSEDLWVQTTANPLWTPYPFAGEPPASLTSHQNPQYRDPKSSKPNYVYVRVRNRGAFASSGTARLRVYWAKASTGLGWATQWTGSDGTGYLPDPTTFGCTQEVLYGDEITKPRKNAATASAAERDRYRDAILKIGTDPAFVFSGGVSYFDKQDGVHGSPPPIAHGSPGFTPWHREFMNRYEVLLREADPRVSLLYWDWTTDPENSTGGFNFFTASFMGASGRGSVSPVAIGLPFSALAPPGVTRRLSSSTTPPAVSDATVLGKPDYCMMWGSLEGSAHNPSHGYIGGGGNMSSVPTAAEDPFFFMLHTDVDRLWAQWQRGLGNTARLDPATSYDPLSANAALTGIMAPWDGSSAIDPWTVAGGYILAKTPKDPSIVFPPIYDTAPLTIPRLQPGESVIFQIPWFPPNPADFACFGADQGHVCLLARIETSGVAPFGMTFAESADLNGNVRNNNNIAWKNVEVLDDFPGLLKFSGLIVRNILGTAVPTRLAFTIPPDNQNDSFFRYGGIFVDLGPDLFKKWTDGGGIGNGVEIVGGNVIQIFGNSAFIDNLALSPDEMRVIQIRFKLNANYPPPGSPVYHFDIAQYGAPNQPEALIGGQRYSIDISKLVLVAAGSTWKYLDDGSNQGTAWRQPNFNDTSWSSGAAELGFGDNPVTTINGGPATNRFVTTYFRKAFTVDDPSIYRSLLLRLKRDDGANVFLNGAEIFRSNMPTGAITFSTPATLDVSGAAEDAFFPADVSTALQRLVPGQNTLAVELHQVSPSSSDASFDLELCANAVRNNFPPVLRFAGLNAALAYQVGQPIGFNVDALDPDDNVSLVEFFVDGISRQRDTAAPFTFVLSNAPPGGHLLMAMATDSMGNSSSEAVSVTVVSNLAPTVVIAAPAEMTEFKTGDAITATAIASDEAGEVALVQFYLREGHDFGAPNLPVGSDNAAPYTADLGALAPGIYFLTAVARDNLGAESPSVPVEFVVTAPVVMTITQNGNTITICWPETAHDYQVEETPELTKPIPWTPVNATVVMEHEMHCVTLQVGNGTRFFRLSRMTMP